MMQKIDYSKPKKLADLPKKYPLIFDGGSIGFECDEGWLNLLDHLLHYIRWNLKRYREVVEIRESIEAKREAIPEWIPKYFKENKHDLYKYFEIAQIKEKFGGLRFYVDYHTADGEQVFSDKIRYSIEGAIDLAESLSFTICERCGQPGTCRSPMSSDRIKEYNESLDLSWAEEAVQGVYKASSGYIQTLCEVHHKEKEEDIIKRHQEHFEKNKQNYLERRANEAKKGNTNG